MLPFRLIMEEELGAVGGVGATSVSDDEDRVLYLDEATLKRMMPAGEEIEGNWMVVEVGDGTDVGVGRIYKVDRAIEHLGRHGNVDIRLLQREAQERMREAFRPLVRVEEPDEVIEGEIDVTESEIGTTVSQIPDVAPWHPPISPPPPYSELPVPQVPRRAPRVPPRTTSARRIDTGAVLPAATLVETDSDDSEDTIDLINSIEVQRIRLQEQTESVMTMMNDLAVTGRAVRQLRNTVGPTGTVTGANNGHIRVRGYSVGELPARHRGPNGGLRGIRRSANVVGRRANATERGPGARRRRQQAIRENRAADYTNLVAREVVRGARGAVRGARGAVRGARGAVRGARGARGAVRGARGARGAVRGSQGAGEPARGARGSVGGARGAGRGARGARGIAEGARGASAGAIDAREDRGAARGAHGARRARSAFRGRWNGQSGARARFSSGEPQSRGSRGASRGHRASRGNESVDRDPAVTICSVCTVRQMSYGERTNPHLSRALGVYDSLFEGSWDETQIALFATLFALFDIPDTADVFIGYPPVWLPLGLSNTQAHEFQIRYHAGFDSLRAFMREATAEARAVEFDPALIRPPRLSDRMIETISGASIWDEIMRNCSSYEGLAMMGTLDTCVKHMCVSLVLEDMRVYGRNVPRGSMRGPGPSFIPWWARDGESTEAQYFRQMYRMRLPTVRDLGWRVLRRMSRARDIFSGGVMAAARFHSGATEDEDEDEDDQ